MAKTDFKSVPEYLATLPKETRATLQRVRAILRKAVPKGEEVISYQIPAVKLAGRAVIYFAGWKEHYSLYPATEKVVASFERELADYELRKGTIRFPLAEAVPHKLIAGIAKVRAAETAALLKKVPLKRRKTTTKIQAKSKAKKAQEKTRPRGMVKNSRPPGKLGRRPRNGGE